MAVFTLHLPVPSVCPCLRPSHLTQACAQLECRCVGVSVGTRSVQPSSRSQFAATCLALLFQFLLLTTWKIRLSVGVSVDPRTPPLSLPSVLGVAAALDHPLLLRLRQRPALAQLGRCVCERKSDWRRQASDPERAKRGSINQDWRAALTQLPPLPPGRPPPPWTETAPLIPGALSSSPWDLPNLA